MNSSLVERLGIQFPLLQAPMAGVQGSTLAIAVCHAGGLGALPCAMLDPDAVRAEIAAIRAATSHPYNVNFFCHTPAQPDPVREAAWRVSLSAYYREFGIDPDHIAAARARRPFDADMADAIEALAPPVVSFHFGLPATDLLDRVRGWGAVIISSATTVAEARWLEARGVDAIIAQGAEAGGHRGMFLTEDISTQLGTFALLPQVVRAVNIPVIAAGGIADATGVAAAMTLGAAGVQIGSAYLLCPEAATSPVHRAALQGHGAATTALTNVFTGRPARSIVNRLVREQGPMATTTPAFPMAAAAVAPIRAAAEARGSGDFSPLWCGQNAGGSRAIPAAQLTRELGQGFAR